MIDNGDGMTREELEALRKRIADRNSRSIGLTNLDRRLRLRYHGGNGLRICPIKNLGTACSFAVPLQKIYPRMPRKRVKQNNKMPGRYLKLAPKRKKMIPARRFVSNDESFSQARYLFY